MTSAANRTALRNPTLAVMRIPSAAIRLFVNAASGDFRVKDGSPALKTGFKNFPMDQFGVKKPELKAIAKTRHPQPASDGNHPANRTEAATTATHPESRAGS